MFFNAVICILLRKLKTVKIHQNQFFLKFKGLVPHYELTPNETNIGSYIIREGGRKMEQ